MLDILERAVEAHRIGNVELAIVLYQEILQIQPEQSDALHNLGVMAMTRNDLEAALPLIERATISNPSYAQYWLSYIDALIAVRDFTKARDVLIDVELHGVKGIEINKINEKISLSEKSVAADRNIDFVKKAADPSNQKLSIRNKKNKNSKSLAAPSDKDVLKIIQNFNTGNYEEIIPELEVIIKKYPKYSAGWKILGAAFASLGDTENGIKYSEHALSLNPDDPATNNNLGNLYKLKHDHIKAQNSFVKAIKLDPKFAAAYNNLGMLKKEKGLLSEAKEHFEQAITLDPEYPHALNNLGLLLSEVGDPELGVKYCSRALEINPEYSDAHSNLLFMLLHIPEMDPQKIFLEHIKFSDQFERPYRSSWPKHQNNQDPNRSIKIGFVSADLRDHAVASFLLPLINYLYKSESFLIYAYSNSNIYDHVSKEINDSIHVWLNVVGFTNKKLSDQIMKDEIDILIDLSGHTGGNRLPVFAMKPAPLQVSWMGYPGTTGLEAVDYYIATEKWLPHDMFANHFTEKLLYLPPTIIFQPVSNSPDILELPALHNEYITFGSFNRFDKINRETVKLWCRVLKELPDSKMLIGNVVNELSLQRMLSWFEEDNISIDRLMFHRRMPLRDYLNLHNQVDICLDTFPYSGSTTVLNSIWMGIPTVTIHNESAAGRQSIAALRQFGLDAFIAKNKDDFVAAVLLLSSELNALSYLRHNLRGHFLRSTVDKTSKIGPSLEFALKSIWAKWCKGESPESFTVK